MHRTIMLLLPSIASLAASAPLRAQPAPAGWTARSEDSTVNYIPSDVPARQLYMVTAYPLGRVTGGDSDAWLTARATADVASIGTIDQRGEPSAISPMLGMTSLRIRNRRGAPIFALYFRLQPNASELRLVRVLASSADVLRTYQAATTQLLTSMAGIGARVASANAAPSVGVATGGPARAPVGSGSDDVSRISSDMLTRETSPERGEIRPGGRLIIGTYRGLQVPTRTGVATEDITLSLYANGEFRVRYAQNPGTSKPVGNFSYDPQTGRIDLTDGRSMELVNSSFQAELDFAVMGRGRDGAPMLYAEFYRGFSTTISQLKYIGPNQLPSPTAETVAAAAAEAEAARYKFVVAPGRGIQDAQIAAVYMDSKYEESVSQSGQRGTVAERTLYLLLTDGTIREGIPVAPDEMDVSVSRQREPSVWGRWRDNALGVLVTWNRAPATWARLRGARVRKFLPTDILRGRFSGGDSWMVNDVASYELYSVTFSANNEFEMTSDGGSSSGTMTQMTGGMVTSTTRSDDITVTSATLPGAVITSTAIQRNPERAGTYRVNGWNLEARFGTGRVARQPIFFVNDKRDAIYWNGKIVKASRENR
jgi:hypothetical protein